MAKTAKTAKILLATLTGLVASEKIQRTLFGEYSDGSVRSIPDALDGEILSPKDRERMFYKKKKGKKKSKDKINRPKKGSSKKKKTRKIGKINMSL